MPMRDGEGRKEVEPACCCKQQAKPINANVYKQLAKVMFYIFFKGNPFIPVIKMYLHRINSLSLLSLFFKLQFSKFMIKKIVLFS